MTSPDIHRTIDAVWRIESARVIATLARIEEGRLALGERWARRAEPAGFPAFVSLPDPPEPALAEA